MDSNAHSHLLLTTALARDTLLKKISVASDRQQRRRRHAVVALFATWLRPTLPKAAFTLLAYSQAKPGDATQISTPQRQKSSMSMTPAPRRSVHCVSVTFRQASQQ